jgi:hypothetical protein
LILRNHFENRNNLEKITYKFSEIADYYAFRNKTVGSLKRVTKNKKGEGVIQFA